MDHPQRALVRAMADVVQERLDEAAADLVVAETHVETTPPDCRHHLQVAIAWGQAAWPQMPPSKLTPLLVGAVGASRRVSLLRRRAPAVSPC